LKAIAMIVFGLLLSMVGSDIETGASRMAFNIPELADGLGFATVAMGVFGFAEIIRNLDAGAEMDRELVQQKVTGLMPTKKDLIDSAPAIVRGTILGSILGILPGGGAVIASFAAYTFEKKIAKDPSRFGRGAIEGVAAPDLVHPAIDARHSAQRGDGADGRRDDHSWHRAGSAGDAEAARTGVGHDRFDVDRQFDAAGHQSAAGGHLGAVVARAISFAVSGDRDLLRHRYLLA
jgi:hypothetical protein